MIPILNSNQTRAADAYTIKNEPIKSIDLMERASRAFFVKFLDLISPEKEIIVFAGVGNNGGDALAVSRMLLEKGKSVSIYTIGNKEKASDDFQTNFDRLTTLTIIRHLEKQFDFPEMNENHVIIDGIFGSGLTRPVTGLFGKLIQTVNRSGAKVCALDIPSGLFSDSLNLEGEIVRANFTITFQTPKLSYFQPQVAPYVGDWHVVDIGLNKEFIIETNTDCFYTEILDIHYPKRSKFMHKGDAGRVLLVSGSKGKMGSTTLCARAAIRSGVGLLFVHAPVCGLDILQISVPEAMVEVDEHTEVISEVLPGDDINVIAIGPGIGTGELTQKAISDLILKFDQPLVVDADGINIISKNRNLLKALPPESILTPHPGEFKRLVGEWENDFEKLEKLKSFCQEYRLNVVLKGAYSAVCNSEGKIYFNSTGNPGMATGGSGDVLTGIIAALLAQGMKPFIALKSAVYIHGYAADMAAVEKGEVSLIPSDVIEYLPKAFSMLRTAKN